MADLMFDIETDGLVPNKIHCVFTEDLDTGAAVGYLSEEALLLWVDIPGVTILPLAAAGPALAGADHVLGKNIIGYDVPVCNRLLPDFKVAPDKVVDLEILVRLRHPDTDELDRPLIRKGTLIGTDLLKPHSLKTWGKRIGVYKGEVGEIGDPADADVWAHPTLKMLLYCMQDVKVQVALYRAVLTWNLDPRAVRLEHDFAWLMREQERYGFQFDGDRATCLLGKLNSELALVGAELVNLVPPKEIVLKTKTKYEPFNPGSRVQVVKFLLAQGWVPAKFTPAGQPALDDDVLETLPDIPSAPFFRKYFTLVKLIGYVDKGKNSWLKLVQPDGRVHGGVITLGTVTHRCAHVRPNMGQIPSDGAGDKSPMALWKAAYGHDCRALFTVPDGFSLVGVDAQGLQLRLLAHYMGRYDGGEYAKIILTGDIHAANQKAAGLPTRDMAKTFIYAWLFGAGNEKIGRITGGWHNKPLTGEQNRLVMEQVRWMSKSKKYNTLSKEEIMHRALYAAPGGQLKDRFLASLPALAALKADVEVAAKRGGLFVLDGRFVECRSLHAALNTLLMSSEAVVMKTATVLMDRAIGPATGMVKGTDWGFVAHVHDEAQAQVRTPHAEEVGKLGAQSVTAAGEAFGLRIRLDGSYKIGRNWAETH